MTNNEEAGTLELLTFLRQHATPAMDLIFEGITALGEQMVLAGICCLIYWCLNKKAGRYLVLCLGISVGFNTFLKDLVQAPRPFWEANAPDAVRIHTAGGYSFPSGHSQSAAVFYTALATQTTNKALRFGLAALVAAVGFSRLYLGVHYLQDVVVGIALGIAIAFGVLMFLNRQMENLAMILCGVAAVLALWSAQSPNTYGAAGLAAGLAGGLVAEGRIQFSMPQNLRQGCLRFAMGGVLIGGMYLGAGYLLERTPLFYLLRNILIAFMVTAGYPWLFTKLEKRHYHRKK